MRVCFVSHDASLGGAERALLEMLLVLQMKHIESFVVLPRRGPLLNELTRLGIPFAIIRYWFWMGAKVALWKRLGIVLLDAVAAIPVMILLHKWKVNLVCTNSIAVITGALAAWIGRKPHVWFIHEFIDERYDLVPYLPVKVTLRLVDILSRGILASSESIRRGYAENLPSGKIRVAYQAALPVTSRSSPGFRFKRSLGPLCVSVGRLCSGKGHSDAILAVGNLIKRSYAVQLTIVGEAGPDKGRLEALVETENLREKVSFAGFVPNVSSMMDASDVILVCSRNEGFGRVALEAMRLGKPVIAAASGGLVELVTDGIDGLLYTPGDYEELAEKLLLLLQSPELRMKLVANGRHSVERFSLDAYGTAVLAEFDQVLNMPPSKSVTLS